MSIKLNTPPKIISPSHKAYHEESRRQTLRIGYSLVDKVYIPFRKVKVFVISADNSIPANENIAFGVNPVTKLKAARTIHPNTNIRFFS